VLNELFQWRCFSIDKKTLNYICLIENVEEDHRDKSTLKEAGPYESIELGYGSH
jgi:hypothetical protein